MKVTIHTIPRELLVHTISLTPTHTDKIHLIRCYFCTIGLLQIKGDVVRIEPGYIPSTQISLISQCYKCHQYFTYQTIENKYNGRIQLRLFHSINERDKSQFHCIFCRVGLLEYSFEFVRDLITRKIVSIGYIFDCPTKTCGTRYELCDVI